MSFLVVVGPKADAFISVLPEKDQRIVHDTLERLADDPFPGKGGDKEKMVLPGGLVAYRMHIGRSYTAFYTIDKDTKIVPIHYVMTIEQAHKRYGR